MTPRCRDENKEGKERKAFHSRVIKTLRPRQIQISLDTSLIHRLLNPLAVVKKSTDCVKKITTQRNPSASLIFLSAVVMAGRTDPHDGQEGLTGTVYQENFSSLFRDLSSTAAGVIQLPASFGRRCWWSGHDPGS